MADETPETDQPTSAEDETSSSETPEAEQPTSPVDEATSSEPTAGEEAEEAIDKAQQAAEAIATDTAETEPETLRTADLDGLLSLLVDRGLEVKVRHTYGHWRQLKEQSDLSAGEVH